VSGCHKKGRQKPEAQAKYGEKTVPEGMQKQNFCIFPQPVQPCHTEYEKKCGFKPRRSQLQRALQTGKPESDGSEPRFPRPPPESMNDA
jgi:hypothetical protein